MRNRLPAVLAVALALGIAGLVAADSDSPIPFLQALQQHSTNGFDVRTTTADSSAIDAFGRQRVSNPVTLFDSKQTFDNQPLFWDESLESGGGISSAHTVDTASTVITSTASTAGVFTRQTFMYFNYSPGKSQLIYMTGVLDRSGGGAGVQRRIGYFNDNNGLFFEDDEGTIKVVRRTNVTGSPVDNKVAQAAWNLDRLDGKGPSGVAADWAKAQIFCIDFEWLGVGRVRFGVVINGRIIPVHAFLNANVLDKVFMSTPNLPLRYQIVTTGSSPASTMESMCGTVITEGGRPELGVNRLASTSGTHVDANTENTIYAIVGIRLKAADVGASIDVVDLEIAELAGGNQYEWLLIHNPTVAGTFTYNDVSDSSVQLAIGATTNTVTNGHQMAGGFDFSGNRGGATGASIDNEMRLGSAIDGTLDTLVLCVRPIGGSINLDVEGSITFRER